MARTNGVFPLRDSRNVDEDFSEDDDWNDDDTLTRRGQARGGSSSNGFKLTRTSSADGRLLTSSSNGGSLTNEVLPWRELRQGDAVL